MLSRLTFRVWKQGIFLRKTWYYDRCHHHGHCVLVVPLSSHPRIWREDFLMNQSPPMLLRFFLKWRLSQQAGTTVARHSLMSCMWTGFPNKSHYTRTTSSTHSNFLRLRVYACLDVTCHQHFWQNNQSLLCTTAVTQGVERPLSKSQQRKNIREENPPARIWTCNLLMTSLALYQLSCPNTSNET